MMESIEGRDVMRLSEMLGRIDGKLDGALAEQKTLRDASLENARRISDLEKGMSRLIGWAIGAGIVSSTVASTLLPNVAG